MRSLYRILKTKSEEAETFGYKNFPEFGLSASESEERAEMLSGDDVSYGDNEIGEAMRQAEKIINTAKDEAEKIRQEAYEEGREKGMKEGYADGKQQALEEGNRQLDEELGLLRDKIARYIEDVEIEKQKLMEQYIDDLKNIALAIGEKIVQTSLRSSSDIVKRMIVSATEKLKKSAWAKIYVGKNGQQIDVHGDSRLLKELSKLSDNVKIIVMEEEEPGTCIIELPEEVIDISVGTQIENIKEILNNARL